MEERNDSSSNEEQETTASGVDVNLLLRKLLLSVAERLTKICIICEGRSVADSATVKNLVKNMHKFERSLRHLQKLLNHCHKNSIDLGSIPKEIYSAVDDYINPYDWALFNIVEKYKQAGHRLDHALDTVDALESQLLQRLKNQQNTAAVAVEGSQE